jgi:hypothetical protein
MTNGCLFCNDVVEATGLRAAFTFLTNVRAVSVDVAICFECAHLRRTTPAELLDLARRRHERQEGSHAATP